MPQDDFSPKGTRRDVTGRSFTLGFPYLAWVDAQQPKKRRPAKRKDEGGVSVDPRRPQNLFGGAAAEIDFVDD